MSVPKFGLFINLVGSVACTALAFVIPVLIYNKAYALEITKYRIWGHRALIIGGCICGSLSFYSSVKNIIAAFGEGAERTSGLHVADRK
jgi:amino acid permease